MCSCEFGSGAEELGRVGGGIPCYGRVCSCGIQIKGEFYGSAPSLRLAYVTWSRERSSHTRHTKAHDCGRRECPWWLCLGEFVAWRGGGHNPGAAFSCAKLVPGTKLFHIRGDCCGKRDRGGALAEASREGSCAGYGRGYERIGAERQSRPPPRPKEHESARKFAKSCAGKMLESA